MLVASNHLRRIEHVRQVEERELRRVVVEYVAQILGLDLDDDQVTYRCFFGAGGDRAPVANVIIWVAEPPAKD